ncbi:hypothetical protein AAMO2058_001727800 [Amorphochlora amoebiformis]
MDIEEIPCDSDDISTTHVRWASNSRNNNQKGSRGSPLKRPETPGSSVDDFHINSNDSVGSGFKGRSSNRHSLHRRNKTWAFSDSWRRMASATEEDSVTNSPPASTAGKVKVPRVSSVDGKGRKKKRRRRRKRHDSGTIPWEDSFISFHSDELKQMCIAAVRGAVRILKECSDFQATPSVTLNLHLGMGCGQLTQMVVGDPTRHLEHIVAGGPIKQMSNAESLSSTKELVVSPMVWDLIKDQVLEVDLKEVRAVSQKDQRLVSQLSRPFRVLTGDFRLAPKCISLSTSQLRSSSKLSLTLASDQSEHSAESNHSNVRATSPIPHSTDGRLSPVFDGRNSPIPDSVNSPFQKFNKGLTPFLSEFPEDPHRLHVRNWFLSEDSKYRLIRLSHIDSQIKGLNRTNSTYSDSSTRVQLEEEGLEPPIGEDLEPNACWIVQEKTAEDTWIDRFSTAPNADSKVSLHAPPLRALYLGSLNEIKVVKRGRHRRRSSGVNHLLLQAKHTYGDETVYDGVKFTIRLLLDEAKNSLRQLKLPILKKFLPHHVINCLQASSGRTDSTTHRFSSMRSTTIMFIKSVGVPLSDYAAKHKKTLHRAQLLMSVIQHCISSWEGSVNKLLVDDKGVVVLAVFGLPSQRHPDDAARAVLAGLSIAMMFKKHHLSCSIGVVSEFGRI